MTERLAYSPSEVAELLGIHPRTIARLVAQGDLPGVKIGGSIRIPAAALLGLFDQAARSAEVAGGAVS